MNSNPAASEFDQFMPGVYQELHAVAERALLRERPGHSLQPTALVHEAYLRLREQRKLDLENKNKFFGLAACMIRRVLVDHSKRRQRAKRQGNARRVTLRDEMALLSGLDVEILALHEALERLEQFDQRKSRVVELRFFGGLTTREAAEALEVSHRTAAADWTIARAWLRRELRGEDAADSNEINSTPEDPQPMDA